MKEIKRDRAKICEIVGGMLDTPDDVGIYNTTECYQKLLDYVNQERILALGWMQAYACVSNDDGIDIREVIISDILDKASKDLAVLPWEGKDEDTNI
jgi:hypothetical protein